MKLDSYHNHQLEQKRRDFYEGNLLPYYTGNLPPVNSPQYQKVVAELERIFVSDNLIAQGVNRFVNALVGETPDFQMSPKKAARGRVNDWYYNQLSNHTLLSSDENPPLMQAVINGMVEGRGFLRVYVEQDGTPRIHAPKDVVVNRGANDQVSSFEYHYTDENQRALVERQSLDENGALIVDTLQDETVLKSQRLDLNGNFLIMPLGIESVITERVMSLQKVISLIDTMSQLNINRSGYLTHLLLNSQVPESGLDISPGAYNQVFGAEVRKNGQSEVLDPKVETIQPISFELYREAYAHYSSQLFREFSQSFENVGANASGEARIRAQQDFSRRVRGFQTGVESAISGIMTSVGKLLGNKTARVRCHLNLSDSVLTPEQSQAILANFNGGLISHRSALAQLGFKDPDAELSQLAQERENEMQAAAQSLSADEDETA